MSIVFLLFLVYIFLFGSSIFVEEDGSNLVVNGQMMEENETCEQVKFFIFVRFSMAHCVC